MASGSVLRGLLKGLVGLMMIAAVLIFVVVTYSEARQELVCTGHWKDTPSESETAYVQLNEYRWWVRLWSTSHGNVMVQTDKRALTDYISHVRRSLDGRLTAYFFYDYDFGTEKLGKMRGGYRVANKEIVIEFLPEAVFIGTCDH